MDVVGWSQSVAEKTEREHQRSLYLYLSLILCIFSIQYGSGIVFYVKMSKVYPVTRHKLSQRSHVEFFGTQERKGGWEVTNSCGA